MKHNCMSIKKDAQCNRCIPNYLRMVILLTYMYVDVYICHQFGGLESLKGYQESVES